MSEPSRADAAAPGQPSGHHGGSGAQAVPPALAAWYLRGVHRFFWNVLLLAALLGVVIMLMLRGVSEKVRANYAASRKAMLALAPPPVPKDENAAEDYRRATSSPNPIPLLLAAAGKKRCNFHLDYKGGFAMPMRHLTKMRGLARQLAKYAATQARAGEHAGAARSIAAIHAMARHVESDPILISGLVALAISGIADGALEKILREALPARVEDLAAYRKALWWKRRPNERLARMFEGEKAFGQNALDNLVRQRSRRTLQSMLGFGLPEGAGGFFLLIYGSERAFHAEVMDAYIGKFRRGEIMQEDVFKTLMRKRKPNGPTPLTGMLLPVLGRAQIEFLRGQDQARVLDAALAFLQFRIKRGRDPKSLSELVPGFLPAVPKGAFGGRPLRMRLDPKGMTEWDPKTQKNVTRLKGLIRIHTLGENGRDDKGFNNWNHRPGVPLSGAKPDDSCCIVPPRAKGKKKAAAGEEGRP